MQVEGARVLRGPAFAWASAVDAPVELDRARLSLVERKTVERAKGLLMEQKGLSEEAAYKLLRKLAMDQNKRIGDVSREIMTYAKVLKS